MNIWAIQRSDPGPIDGPQISERDLHDGVNWPYPPEWIVRFDLENKGWMLDVEVTTDTEGIRWLTGIVVRSGVPTTATGTQADPWLEGGEFEPLEASMVKQLPLGRYVRAALAIVDDPLTGAGRREARRVLLPPGDPKDQAVGPEWYEELLKMAKEIEKQGRSAVQEIAERKDVSTNVVNQWLHRARQLSKS